MYNTDSIYDNYLSADGPRQSQSASTLSGVGTGRLSGLAPPIPRSQNGRQTAYSMADTASVYTTATAPFERWSLEDGLEPPAPKSPTSVYAAGGGTQRPPDSPRLADLRSMPGPARTAPMHTQTPVATSMSPQPVQYSRRHFSRPFRPEDTEDQSNAHTMATPKIMVGHHRFSASTPDAYGGASFSPALPQDSPQISAYASDIAGDDHDSGHLRRRSNPENNVLDDARSASPTSIYGDEQLRAIGQPPRSSLSGSSLHEKGDEFNEKREPHPRPFSLSNTYPFTTTQNGYGNQNTHTVKSLNHKPSSRFSEDEKGIRSVDSTNEFQSSTWNLFGRSPVASPMWRHSEDGRRNLGGPAPVQPEKQRKKKRIVIWVVAVLILLALAGVGAGIGIWRKNASSNENDSRASSLAGDGSSASPSGSAARPSTTSATTEGNDSADVTIPARDSSAVAGSGGPGGYYSLVAFGGSYADNGHSRSDDYSTTLQVAPYDGGRATNGPVFQEYMSSLVGPSDSESATVLNYAYSGSSVNNTISTFQAPDFPAQVASYLGDLNNANATVAATAAHKALVTVWAGMDELVQIWESAISSNPGDPQTTALADVRSMLSTMNTTLRWLLPTTGAVSPDFVLIALPRGDLLPQTSRLALNNTGYVNVFRNMTVSFNTGLAEVAQSLSASTTVYTLDASGLFESIYTNPPSYNLTSVDVACRDQSCTDPDNFMWFDGMNPSTRMHSLVARHLAATILQPSS